MTVDHDHDHDPDHDDPGDDQDPRVQAGVDHLQRAAREMISASRAFLDVVEDLVERPEAVADLVTLVGSWGDVAVRAAGIPRPHRGPATTGTDPDDDGDDDGPVQRIPVS